MEFVQERNIRLNFSEMIPNREVTYRENLKVSVLIVVFFLLNFNNIYFFQSSMIHHLNEEIVQKIVSDLIGPA